MRTRLGATMELCMFCLLFFCSFYAFSEAETPKQSTTPQPSRISVHVHSGPRVNVPENSQPLTVLSFVSVEGDDDGQVICNAFPQHQSYVRLQRVEAGTYQLLLIKPLDREVERILYIQIRCRDVYSSSPLAYTQIELHVLDENDNSPKFRTPLYNVSVKASVSVGTEVGTVHAEDLDSGQNRDVRYFLTSQGDDRDLILDIDERTGVLRTARILESEASGREVFIVRAYDLGQPPRTGTATVLLSIVQADGGMEPHVVDGDQVSSSTSSWSLAVSSGSLVMMVMTALCLLL
ncbi:hypothetical protein ACOMHN_022275 [Nucella lapillus]